MERSPASSATGETDAGKTVPQHIGGAGLAATSIMNMARVGAVPRVARELPGLNLVVGVVEAVNAVHQGILGNSVEAVGHAGNAAGCLASCAEDVARYVSVAGAGHAMLAGNIALGLGVAGGLFGLAEGTAEIRTGLKEHRETGSTQSLVLGAGDLVSGTATLTGIALNAAHLAPGLGTAMFAVASACDLANLCVEYADVWRGNKAAEAAALAQGHAQ